MSVAKRPKLRDVNKQDVFLFIDNIFCLVQAPSLGSMDDDALLEEQRGMASCWTFGPCAVPDQQSGVPRFVNYCC